jgi:adenylylsulfate kinase
MTQTPKSENIFWHEGQITRADRERLHGHRGVTIWFTGLSGSGKSTLARAAEEALFERGCQVYVLDGDNIRHGLNRDLGFSPEDRKENIRRIGEVAKLFTDFGAIVLTAFISPYREDRNTARAVHADGDFVEVFVDCSLELCEARDPKGLYARARSGELEDFTGVSDPYEPPERPEVVCETAVESPEESAAKIMAVLEERGYVTPQKSAALEEESIKSQLRSLGTT